MPHGHKHGHHHHVDPEAGDMRVALAVGVNLLLTAVQVIGGVLAGSLALIADALHNFSDAISLVIAFGARRIARRPSDEAMTFGYGRVEVVAALINYTTLIVIGVYLVYEAVMRFFEPEEVAGWTVVIIATIALAVDLITAALTFALSKESMNIRAAFLHNVADALGSVAVIVAGTLILLFDWRLIDPLATLLIAGYILWQAFAEIGGVIRILMLGSPPDIETGAVIRRMEAVEGVANVHHAHFWQMSEHDSALDAHLAIDSGAWGHADDIKARVKTMLSEEFGIGHSTLEMECSIHACKSPQRIGDDGHD
jgi:cobalt-zinc-cadmium efflux system protein